MKKLVNGQKSLVKFQVKGGKKKRGKKEKKKKSFQIPKTWIIIARTEISDKLIKSSYPFHLEPFFIITMVAVDVTDVVAVVIITVIAVIEVAVVTMLVVFAPSVRRS